MANVTRLIQGLANDLWWETADAVWSLQSGTLGLRDKTSFVQLDSWPPGQWESISHLAAMVAEARALAGGGEMPLEQGPSPMPPEDPYNGYGGEIGEAEETGGGALVVRASTMLAPMPARVRGLVVWALRAAGGVAGGRVSLAAISRFVRPFLVATLGIEVAEILIDVDLSGPDFGLIDLSFLPDFLGDLGLLDNILGSLVGGNGAMKGDLGLAKVGLAVGEVVQLGSGRTYVIAQTWQANGVWFYRFTDGRAGVRNKSGVWKTWIYHKPVVLMPTGPTDIQSVLRGMKIMKKALKEMSGFVRAFGYQVKRGKD